MGKICLPALLVTLMVLTSANQINGQNKLPSKVDFKNAPVLFREGGKSFQQVIASYRAETPGKIVFTYAGKELLKADLVKGNNRVPVDFSGSKQIQKNHCFCKDR